MLKDFDRVMDKITTANATLSRATCVVRQPNHSCSETL